MTFSVGLYFLRIVTLEVNLIHSAPGIDLGLWKLTFPWCSVCLFIFYWIRAPHNLWNQWPVFLPQTFVLGILVYPHRASTLHAPTPTLPSQQVNKYFRAMQTRWISSLGYVRNRLLWVYHLYPEIVPLPLGCSGIRISPNSPAPTGTISCLRELPCQEWPVLGGQGTLTHQHLLSRDFLSPELLLYHTFENKDTDLG